MDFTKIPPDTILTMDMLEPKEAERILVIENMKQSYEKIRYNGLSELEAYQSYKRIPHNNKVIVNAHITYSDVYRTEFIINYKVTNIIKKGN